MAAETPKSGTYYGTDKPGNGLSRNMPEAAYSIPGKAMETARKDATDARWEERGARVLR